MLSVSIAFLTDEGLCAFGESYHPYNMHTHPCINLYLIIQSTIMNVALVQTVYYFLLTWYRKHIVNQTGSPFPYGEHAIANYVIKTHGRLKQFENDTKTSKTVNQIRSTALERSVTKFLGLTQLDRILISLLTSEVSQNR